MTDIFISYSREDRDCVRHIAAALEAEGLSVWWDPDIPPGESFAQVIDRQLKESACIIVVWSNSSIHSNWVQEEADDGMMRNTLVPVMIDDIDLPRGFKRLQTADLRGWAGDKSNPNWQLVTAQVKKLVAAKSATLAAERQAESRAVQSSRSAVSPGPAMAAPSAPSRETKKGGFLIPAILGLAAIGAGAFGYFFFLQQAPTGGPETADAAPKPLEIASAADDAGAWSPAPAAAPAQEATGSASGPLDDEPAAGVSEPAEAPVEAPLEESADEAVAAAGETAYAPGDIVQDCASCPKMVVVAPGAFSMGAPEGERSADPSESPQVAVTIARPFAIAAYETTFDDWRACLDDGGCRGYEPAAMGWGAGRRPLVNISAEDAMAYADWLSGKTGAVYRLPSEAEWEYAARAGSAEPFSFGAALTTAKANFNGNYPYGDAAAGAYRSKTLPVGSFAPNAFGLYDMHGNVWEWVADCWASSHANAPLNGAPVGGACGQRVIKGGAWNAGGWRLRSAHRKPAKATARDYDTGFRLVREL